MDYNKVVVHQHSKHEYELSIGGVRLGIWERSRLRQLIETIDNQINTGLCDKKK
jgi:hypothetical protein|tara:strand:+ start:108 stop:269 length:162 start_codon:yes stop_codon:yes gene_type:complete